MPNSIVGGVFDFMGLTGARSAPNSIAPQIATSDPAIIAQNFADIGQISNSEVWSRYGSVMATPSTYSSMLTTWKEMASWDLIAAALVQVVDEAIQTDESNPGSLWFECDDSSLEDSLNSMLDLVNLEEILPNQVWHLAGLGNAIEKIEYEKGEGVTGLRFVDPSAIRRYWLERNRQCIGFRWDGHPPPDRSNYWLLDKERKISPVTVGDATDQLWYPWDFLHFRRMYRLRESEHGEPLFDEAQGIYKKMRMALDQMVVHRAQVQPDRYVVNVDVGEQAPTEQMKTLQRWKNSFRAKVAFGRGDANGDPTAFSSMYNAMGLDSVLWMARPKGFAHSIEKLAGTASVPDIYDVEMLTNLFFSVIGMPKEWLGISGQGQNNPASGKALLAQDIRFLRKIKAIRRPLKTTYRWLGYFHALLKGKNIAETDIRVRMSEIGSLDDQLRVDLLTSQANLLSTLGDVMDKYKLPREAWVDVVFRKYLHLPEEIVNAFVTALPDPQVAEGITRDARKSLSTQQMLIEVKKRFDSNGRSRWLIKELQELSDGRRSSPRRKMLTESVIREPQPMIQKGDLIVSSFGPVKEGITAEKPGDAGYRQFVYS